MNDKGLEGPQKRTGGPSMKDQSLEGGVRVERSRTQQSGYRARFSKCGPFWVWHGWHETDDEYTSPWGRGIALSQQSAIWAARRRMIGCIVKAHSRAHNLLLVDGDELVRLADTKSPIEEGEQ